MPGNVHLNNKPSPATPEPPPKLGFFEYIYKSLQRIGVLPKSFEKISQRITDVASEKAPPESPSKNIMDRPVLNLGAELELIGGKNPKFLASLDEYSAFLATVNEKKLYMNILQDNIRKAIANNVDASKLNELKKLYEDRRKELVEYFNSSAFKNINILSQYAKKELEARAKSGYGARLSLSHARIEQITLAETEIWEFLTNFENELEKNEIILTDKDKAAHKEETRAILYKTLNIFVKGQKPLPLIFNKKTSVFPEPVRTSKPLPPAPITTTSKTSTLDAFTAFVENVVRSVARVIQDITKIFSRRKLEYKPILNESETIKRDFKKIKETAETAKSESEFNKLATMLENFHHDVMFEKTAYSADQENKTVMGALDKDSRRRIQSIFEMSQYNNSEYLERRKVHMQKLIKDLEEALLSHEQSTHPISGFFDIDDTYLSAEITPDEPEIEPQLEEEKPATMPKKAIDLGEFRAWEEQKKQHAKKLLNEAALNTLTTNPSHKNLSFFLNPANRDLLEAYIEYAELEKKEQDIQALSYLADLALLRSDQDGFVGKFEYFSNVYLKGKVSPEEFKVIDRLFGDYMMITSDNTKALTDAAKKLLSEVIRNVIDEQFVGQIFTFDKGTLKEFVSWANS